jgi:hypothetical protein
MTIHGECTERQCDECSGTPVAGEQGKFATVELPSGAMLLYFVCGRCSEAGTPKIKREVERFAMHLLSERAVAILHLAEKETMVQ